MERERCWLVRQRVIAQEPSMILADTSTHWRCLHEYIKRYAVKTKARAPSRKHAAEGGRANKFHKQGERKAAVGLKLKGNILAHWQGCGSLKR